MVRPRPVDPTGDMAVIPIGMIPTAIAPNPVPPVDMAIALRPPTAPMATATMPPSTVLPPAQTSPPAVPRRLALASVPPVHHHRIPMVGQGPWGMIPGATVLGTV